MNPTEPADPTDTAARREAGHELNNLLTKVLGYTELALDQLPDDHPVAAELTHVRDAGKRAAELVRELFAPPTAEPRKETTAEPTKES